MQDPTDHKIITENTSICQNLKPFYFLLPYPAIIWHFYAKFLDIIFLFLSILKKRLKRMEIGSNNVNPIPNKLHIFDLSYIRHGRL